MKNILLSIGLIMSLGLFGQTCYTVKGIENKSSVG